MSKPQQPTESVSRVAFWPLWVAGRFLLAILLLSAFALVVAIAASRARYEFALDGTKQPVTPAYMAELNRRSLESSASSRLAGMLAEANYTLYFRWTGVHSVALGLRDPGFVTRVVQRFPDDTAVAMLAARLFGVRTANAILALPLILLVVGLATIDGLTERAIRRECGGHESGTKFRLARRYAFKLLPPVLGIVYLCLPIDLSPGGVLVPTLAVMAILVRTKMKHYKKYV